MNGLTTHILDLMNGKPASDVKIELYGKMSSGEMKYIASRTTNRDGRLDEAFLGQNALKIGTYQLIFHVGDYFRKQAVDLPEPSFLEEVTVQFGVASPEQHYHVPLLVSPWGYQVYRGS
ncbi:hydroxyisourate hydrolase [Bacillus sp. AGMB 02131]|uniref:5-hydroxyisourate hydrolase n=1 Tax=Peribacillus faecalis TaxID=2772559 RepID=A0A927CXN8_9BACI|nr:hydroxyisourate hydrolase [Peribacillus faecalis]MBD3107219.1 hydroxyisourate hydrolase [Peribacillus faecalis]